MDTTAAARTADVTVATIRLWARRGIVAATKTAGRWDIDAASLARRIAIGRRTFKLDRRAALALGGREWQTDRHHRIYFNEWLSHADGIHLTGSSTGQGGAFVIDGDAVSNSRLPRFRRTVRKVYLDLTQDAIVVEHDGTAEAIDVRFIDGRRRYIDLADRIIRGIKAAARETR